MLQDLASLNQPLLAKPPLQPSLQRGVSCWLCLQPCIQLPLYGPQPLGSGLPPSSAPLTQPIECGPSVPQVFGPHIHEQLGVQLLWEQE